MSVPVISRSMTTKVRSTAASGSQVYQSSRAVAEYLLFHFGSPEEIYPHHAKHCPVNALHFPQRCADICKEFAPPKASNGPPLRVLDIGCAVGGASFHLAQHFDEVVGVDFSAQFIEAANEMKNKGEMKYDVYTEGTDMVTLTAKLPVSKQSVVNTRFLVGDACDLAAIQDGPAGLGGPFDVILGSNLLCRLPLPRAFLTSILSRSLLKPGGSLVLVSPYSWLEEYTPKEQWLRSSDGSDAASNCSSNGTSCTGSDNSFNALQRFVNEKCHTSERALQLVHRDEYGVPFLIREHARKFQYGVSDCTVWQNQEAK